MRRFFAPAAVAVVIALSAAPAFAQDEKDSLQKLVEKLSKQVDQLEKKVGELGKKLEESFGKGQGFDMGNLMEKFNDLWNDFDLGKMFGDFKMPDLNDMMEKLRDQFGEQFGDGFNLEDLMEQFKDQFGGVDMQKMMEELRKLFDGGEPDEGDDDMRMPVRICWN